MTTFNLTLGERKLMKELLNEVKDRRARYIGMFSERDELDNLMYFVGEYVTAYKNGNLTLSDIERCGE